MLGGEAIEHENFSSIVNDIGLLHSLGIRLVVVYGARPQIEANPPPITMSRSTTNIPA